MSHDPQSPSDAADFEEDDFEIDDEDVEDDGCCQECGACPGFIGAECDEDCEHSKAQSEEDEA